MDRLIEFSRRSTIQLRKILEFYDEQNVPLQYMFSATQNYVSH